MRFKSIAKIISYLLVLVMFSSCATLPPPGTHLTDEERQTAKNRCIAQYTITSAIGGALVGAAIGALVDGGRGAAKGAIIGGVAGGVIGFAAAWNHCLALFSNLETYPVADYKQTAQDINYQPSQGDVVEIKDLAVTPSAAPPGSTLALSGKYIVMNADPNARDIKVLIEHGVAGFDEKTKTFKVPTQFVKTEKTIDATNRTNKLDGPFDIPDKCPPGKFKVVVRITALNKTVIDGAEVEVTKEGNIIKQWKPVDTAPKVDKSAEATTPATTATPHASMATSNKAGPGKAAGEKSLVEPEKTGQAATLKEARQAKKNQDLEGVLFQDKNSKVWFLETEDGTYKLRGDKFIKVGAQAGNEPPSAAPPASKAAPDKSGPNKDRGEKSQAEAGKTTQTPTLKEAREAKKNQGLEGRLFQDNTSKVWYLENEDGTYRLKNGKFVLIRSN